MIQFFNKTFFFLFFSFVFTINNVLEINNFTYSDELFYSFFPKNDWEALSKKQKSNYLNEFINKKILVHEAQNQGFIDNPFFNSTLQSRINQFLVNVSYDFFVVLPLVPDSVFLETKKHLKTEINVNHLLVGYKNCKLPSSFSRSKEEAKTLAFSFYENLKSGVEFSSLVSSFSDDPSSDKNNGNLGWLSWGKTVPVFQSAAFALSPGSFSTPILTDFGYHIIYCNNLRKSSFFYIDSTSYELKCLETSLSSVPLNLKKDAAKKYDKKTLLESSLVFNYKTLNYILNHYIETNLKNKVVSGSKRSFIKTLEELEEKKVLCVYNGKGYGLRWFLNHLSSFPSSRIPKILSIEDLKNIFNTIILQKIALEKIYNNYNSFSLVINSEVKNIKENLIADSFLKKYINNLKDIPSDSVLSYYNKNLSKHYMEKNLVSVREIKTKSQNTADSLYVLLKKGSSFLKIAKNNSLTNPINGGLINPFIEGKYGPLGKIAFSLKEKTFSSPFSNLDNSWSIIYLEEKIDSLPISIEKVYSKIETILNKNYKKQSRESFLADLKNKYSVNINNEFFNFE